MQKIFFGLIAINTFLLAACNNDPGKKEQAREISKDSSHVAAATDDKNVKVVAITYTNVDAKAAACIKEIVDHYLHLKNALANDNSGEAASGGKAMEESMRKLDKSLFTSEQKKVYDEIEDGLKEDAEHIGKNGDNIKHQREHFSMMSEDVYDLVKAFGGGRILYHDHCPMYNENKGANWLSEMKDVKNPYLGGEMPACGSVEEVIK